MGILRFIARQRTKIIDAFYVARARKYERQGMTPRSSFSEGLGR